MLWLWIASGLFTLIVIVCVLAYLTVTNDV
jgi:hypothetical protein